MEWESFSISKITNSKFEYFNKKRLSILYFALLNIASVFDFEVSASVIHKGDYKSADLLTIIMSPEKRETGWKENVGVWEAFCKFLTLDIRFEANSE